MSVSVTKKTVFGDQRVHFISFVAGAAEENIATGLNFIEHFSVGIKSVTTGAYFMDKNVNSTLTVANGTIGVSGVVSGDHWFIAVYGR